MAVKIRKATIEDIPKIKPLINAYSSPYKSLDFLRWFQFGTQIPTITFCAEDGGDLVGMFMVYKRKLNNGLKCGVLMGLIVIEKWRGTGLFKELGENAMNYFKDLDMFCCLTNMRGEHVLEKNFNFRTISRINTMYLDISGVNDCQHSYINKKITPDTRFNSFKSDIEEINMFLADDKFRQWRFTSHPRYSYNMLQMDSKEFAITNIYVDDKKEIRYCDIVDFELLALEKDRLIELIKCVCLSLQKDVNLITVQSTPNSLLYNILKEIGFAESNTNHYFSLKVKDSHNEHLYKAENWAVKWGDYLR